SLLASDWCVPVCYEHRRGTSGWPLGRRLSLWALRRNSRAHNLLDFRVCRLLLVPVLHSESGLYHARVPRDALSPAGSRLFFRLNVDHLHYYENGFSSLRGRAGVARTHRMGRYDVRVDHGRRGGAGHHHWWLHGRGIYRFDPGRNHNCRMYGDVIYRVASGRRVGSLKLTCSRGATHRQAILRPELSILGCASNGSLWRDVLLGCGPGERSARLGRTQSGPGALGRYVYHAPETLTGAHLRPTRSDRPGAVSRKREQDYIRDLAQRIAANGGTGLGFGCTVRFSYQFNAIGNELGLNFGGARFHFAFSSAHRRACSGSPRQIRHRCYRSARDYGSIRR